MTDMTTKFSRYVARATVKKQVYEAKNRGTTNDYIYLQTWLILATVCLFAGTIAYQQGLIEVMLQTDQSYLSLLILIIFLVASGHAAWNIAATATRIEAAGKMLDGKIDESFQPNASPLSARTTIQLSDPPNQFVGNFVRDVKDSSAHARATSSAQSNNHILEIYADQLRAPVELGWFIVDILIRLGLLGTIVGFILILRSLIDGPLPSADQIQTLLVSMSGGMGTALFTTLAGLTTATLLGVQYMVLGRSVETLIASLIRIDERTQAPNA